MGLLDLASKFIVMFPTSDIPYWLNYFQINGTEWHEGLCKKENYIWLLNILPSHKIWEFKKHIHYNFMKTLFLNAFPFDISIKWHCILKSDLPITTSWPSTKPAEKSSWETPSAVSVQIGNEYVLVTIKKNSNPVHCKIYLFNLQKSLTCV